MGKLADFMAMKRDLAFDYERELRAARNLILGVNRISGTEYTIDLTATEGIVAGGRARAAFVEAFHAAAHEALLKYAQDLAHESLAQGVDQQIVGSALGGAPASDLPAPRREDDQPAAATGETSTIRLVVCA